jgi:GDP-L-fucose synthase
LLRQLIQRGSDPLTVDRDQLDLREQASTYAWIADHQPDAIIIAAAKVGGIVANQSLPADFLFDNVSIAFNVMEGAARAGVRKLLFIASSSIYPRLAAQPMEEGALLTGPLEPTHEGYAIAKIAGLKLAQAHRQQHQRDFITAVPTNLYGPGDKFDLQNSHVLPALIRKVHEAKRSGQPVVVWGSGTPRRELLHADDCAAACLFLLENYSGDDHVNVGFGSDVSILELTKMVADVIGYRGEIILDRSKPDGPPRKMMNSDRLLALGWKPSVSLRDGIEQTYRWYLHNIADVADDR